MQIRSILLVALAALLPVAFARLHHHKADIIDASNIDQMFAGDAALRSQFSEFKSIHGKEYGSAALEEHRFQIFSDNMKNAVELQKKNPEAVFGMNQFSDMHPVEFKKQYLHYIPAVGDAALLRQAAPVRQASRSAINSIPTSYDWRKPDQNRPVGITAVKDQGQCGSCWAFSATEAVESAWILAGHKAVSLAPQQTVDCDTVDGGCNGGDTVTAYKYMESNGVQTEESYPYTSGDSGSAGTCAYNSSAVAAKMTSFTYATPGCSDACTNQNEAKLAEAIYNVGPASICVDASTWQSYVSGVLTSASGCQSAYSALDHCVQLIGYGVDSATNTPYWTVRNSWASSWGEAGMIRIQRGSNTCGVADEATQVTI